MRARLPADVAVIRARPVAAGEHVIVIAAVAARELVRAKLRHMSPAALLSSISQLWAQPAGAAPLPQGAQRALPLSSAMATWSARSVRWRPTVPYRLTVTSGS